MESQKFLLGTSRGPTRDSIQTGKIGPEVFHKVAIKSMFGIIFRGNQKLGFGWLMKFSIRPGGSIEKYLSAV